MTWFENAKKQQKHAQQNSVGPVQVVGISAIPFDASPTDRFRLTVDVEQMDQRETSAGNPCYFVACRDAEDMTLSIVIWESQMSRIKDRIEEGKTIELDIKVPKEGYSAFTLA